MTPTFLALQAIRDRLEFMSTVDQLCDGEKGVFKGTSPLLLAMIEGRVALAERLLKELVADPLLVRQ